MSLGLPGFRGIVTPLVTCCFISILATGADLWGQVKRIAGAAAVNATEPADPNKPMPLVNADEEIANYLSQAQTLIKQKNYSRAIEIVQTILNRQDIGFVGTSDGHRYLSLGVKINELLGQMGPEGLKTYRELYDPQAQRLYEQAGATGDTVMLGRIISHYRYTRYGPKAMEMLAAAEFDAGGFSQAAKFWQDRLNLAEPDEKPLLLTKIAVAAHLGGQESLAKKALDPLEKDYPAAVATVCGREQNLLAFAREAMKLPPYVCPPQETRGWPGLGGAGGRPPLMNESEVVLSGRWRYPADGPLAGEEAQSKLLVGNLLPQAGSPMYEGMAYRDNRRQMAVKLKGGHLRTQVNWGGRNTAVTLPPTISPVVVDQTAIFRTRNRVVGCDLLTGKETWAADLPMERTPKNIPVHGGYYYGGYMANFCDTGQYMLTAGRDQVFAVYGFRPEMMGAYFGGHPANRQEADSSALVALSISRQGARLWSVGLGAGDAELLQNGKYYSVPTYCDGRLYVVILYLETYHLACLDAQTGKLIWKSIISQVPTLSRTYGMPMQLFRGSPPAVADGKVFVLTNGGVIAAFDARNGQAAWAYQYDSELNKGQGVMHYSGGVTVRIITAPSPVLVGQDRIIVMPSDTNQVLCLSNDDGRSLWSLPRQDQTDLSSIDSERLLLSGDKLIVLSMADGKVLHATDKLGIVGRPAVAPHAILASGDLAGDGKLIRMDLKDYSLRTLDLADAGAILGNLVSVGGKVLASNALGASLYMDYDAAVAELNVRLRDAQESEKAEVLFDLARLSFNAHRFETTLDALNRCKAACDPSSPVGLQLIPWFYRTHVAMGNMATRPDEMLASFRQAFAYATTPQEKGHVSIRVAKAEERAGRYAKAFAAAQAISEEFASEQLADVEIGPRDMLVRIGPDTKLTAGRELGQKLVQEFIEKGGRAGYKEFDDRAKATMDKAIVAGDPDTILKIYENWPHSIWAGPTVFAAAEAFYLRAGADDKDGKLVKARELLELVTRISEDKKLKLSASAALAVLWTRAQSKIMARCVREDIPDSAMDQEVKFADIQGTLRDVLGNLDRKPATRPVEQPLALRWPIKLRLHIEDSTICVVRETEHRPIQLGERLLIEKGDKLHLLDMAAPDAGHAVVGPGLTLPGRTETANNPGLRRPLAAALSRDQRTAAVVEGHSVVGIDMKTGEARWPAMELSRLGLAKFSAGIGGEGCLLIWDIKGNHVALDAATGQVLWGPAAWYTKNKAPGSYAFVRHGQFLVYRWDLKKMLCIDLQSGKLLGELALYSPPASLSEGQIVGLAPDRKSLVVWDPVERKQNSRPYNPPPGGLQTFSSSGRKDVVVATLPQPIHAANVPAKNPAAPASLQVEVISVYETKATPLDIGDRKTRATTARCGEDDGRIFLLVQGYGDNGITAELRAFDAANRKLMWTQPLGPVNQGQELWLLGKEFLVVQSRVADNSPTVNYRIFKASDGEKVDTISSQLPQGQLDGRLRQRMIGAPMAIQGHLILETMEGVNVYGN